MKSPLINLIILILFFTFFLSCNKSTEQKPPVNEPKTVNTSSSTKSPAGEYSGKIPCADCEGIDYTLSLQPSMDFTSTLVYLGKEVPPLVSNGRWQIGDDSLILLTSTSDVPSYLRIYNDSLEMLNESKQKMIGPAPSSFILRKVNLSKSTKDAKTSSAIPNEKFILESLNGKSVSSKDYMKGLPEIKINSQTGTVTGSSGCNSMNSKVIISNDEISFSDFAMTRMSCPGSGEADFIAALKSSKKFKLESNKLQLMDGNKTLLVFAMAK